MTALSKKELIEIIEQNKEHAYDKIIKKADEVRRKSYGTSVFFRGLIEFSNYCKNDCLYCGIRRSNTLVNRYRLSEKEILECCEIGYNLGFKTFVLQSGEDAGYSDYDICFIVNKIKEAYPDCAVTLSIGEKKREVYLSYFKAGADRYLLRHETADDIHYSRLHPENMTLKNRKQCLYDLKEIGFQTGAGFMVGSPYQTSENLADDLLFLMQLQPEMVGIGPFIPHKDTPFGNFKSGTLNLSILMISLTRILIPKALLPATTALGTISPRGREEGLKAGANVVMPNLSPLKAREAYTLYDDKICTGDEAAECVNCISRRIKDSGYTPDFSRGDALGFHFAN